MGQRAGTLSGVVVTAARLVMAATVAEIRWTPHRLLPVTQVSSSMTLAQSSQTLSACSDGYHGDPGCPEGCHEARAMAKVSRPQTVRGPGEEGAPGAPGAACTRRTGVLVPPPGPVPAVPADGSSSYTTMISMHRP